MTGRFWRVMYHYNTVHREENTKDRLPIFWGAQGSPRRNPACAQLDSVYRVSDVIGRLQTLVPARKPAEVKLPPASTMALLPLFMPFFHPLDSIAWHNLVPHRCYLHLWMVAPAAATD